MKECEENLIPVLLVDDHPIARAGLKTIVSTFPKMQVIGEASNGLDALQQTKTLKPMLIFMDIHMPGIDGLEASRRIINFNPRIKIIVISTFTNDVYPCRLLEIGAVGYLSKHATQEEVFKSIRTVLAGQHYISPNIAHTLAFQHIDKIAGLSWDILTLRELQVALMLVKGNTVKDIVDILYLSEKTIMGYRCSMFKKLNIKNEVQLILFAKKCGLMEILIK